MADTVSTGERTMSGLVERLGWHHEHPVTGKLVLRNPDGPEAADTITRLKAALERVRGVIESGYRGVDKADKCPHDRFGFEDCIACYDEALLAAIDGSSLGGE